MTIAERFKEFDRDGNGRLTREEVPRTLPFDLWDADKDGVVSLEEVTAYYARQAARPRGKAPDEIAAQTGAAKHPGLCSVDGSRPGR